MLIAESGASKISWCLITDKQLYHFETDGIRCGHTESAKISRVLNQASTYFHEYSFDKLFFYSSGCLAENRQDEMKNYLRSHFTNTKHISVLSDLHAAARATHGENSGLTFILGTGSVIFNWNGHNVTDVVGGKGFPGGDPASGADLGYQLITYLRQNKNSKLRIEFENEFEDIDYLVNFISNNNYSASDYASFAPFVIENKHDPDIANLIDTALSNFFADLPENYITEKISVVGSIGFYLKDEIQHKLSKEKSSKIRFERQPISGLIEFHRLISNREKLK